MKKYLNSVVGIIVLMIIIFVCLGSCRPIKKLQKTETSNVVIFDSIKVATHQAQYDVTREEVKEIDITYPCNSLDTMGSYFETVINIGKDSQVTVKSNKPIKSIKVKQYKSIDSSGLVANNTIDAVRSYNATTKLDIKESKKGSDFWFWFFIIIAIAAGSYVFYKVRKIKF